MTLFIVLIIGLACYGIRISYSLFISNSVFENAVGSFLFPFVIIYAIYSIKKVCQTFKK